MHSWSLKGVLVYTGVERLRQQDPRSLLRERLDQTANDRRQQAARRDGGRRRSHCAVQARVSVDLRVGDQGQTAGRGRLQRRQHTQRKPLYAF